MIKKWWRNKTWDEKDNFMLGSFIGSTVAVLVFFMWLFVAAFNNSKARYAKECEFQGGTPIVEWDGAVCLLRPGVTVRVQ